MKKRRLKFWFLNCHNINVALLWLILKRYTILDDIFQLDSVRYRDEFMTALKFDWSNLKILMSGWYRRLTSSCVPFTIYQQCHSDIESDVTPISLQYQNVHWVMKILVEVYVGRHFPVVTQLIPIFFVLQWTIFR